MVDGIPAGGWTMSETAAVPSTTGRRKRTPKVTEWYCDPCHSFKPPSAFPQTERGEQAGSCFQCLADDSHETDFRALVNRELMAPTEEAKVWGGMAVQILKTIKPSDLEALDAKNRVAAAAMCFDKRQVLLEKPTEIIKVKDRRKLLVIAEKLQAELEFRQHGKKTIEATCERIDG